ncbi:MULTISPECIES: SEC-C metal-binding domain-containing protein [Micromonospora]|uniref:Preprotein translocase subunit SecA n=1 Tax=Micromonospora sicca TaxID=2202420 RepID=A0A317DK40_9ACTN|nr:MULTISPECIES: SEC-C metal-binding domain-containing protein [unclassified Micromonospora]MBM0228033.1 SEC-C domain-containing protein [Micromonospora sp. ATA51]PWR14948.1 hypothetical protein DKT69_13560 [Micromonospora sp. 4G51]
MTPSSELLSSHDLDEIAHLAYSAPDPEALVTRLVDAVDGGHILNKRDFGYALTLAAEIVEREEDDPERALALAERAIDVYRTHGEPDGYSRAMRARLLHRLGRVDDAMAGLEELRPLLTVDPAAIYVTEVLEEVGYDDLAERWLTDAVRELLDRSTDRPYAAEESQQQTAAMVYGLVQQRHRLRGEMELPHDDLDNLADRLRAASSRALDQLDDGPHGIVFWPRPEFNALLLRWPALAETYGTGWDDHRARAERDLVALAEEGVTDLGLVAGSADGLATFARDADLDPTDLTTVDEYADSLLAEADPIPWPPGRNEPCWCGSGSKYKKCCLPRSRS